MEPANSFITGVQRAAATMLMPQVAVFFRAYTQFKYKLIQQSAFEKLFTRRQIPNPSERQQFPNFQHQSGEEMKSKAPGLSLFCRLATSLSIFALAELVSAS